MSTINRYFTVREGTPVADDGTSDSPILRHSVFRPGDRVCKVVISSDVYHRLLDQFKDETYENVGAKYWREIKLYAASIEDVT